MKEACANRTDCYIGIDDRAASVVFQVERDGPPKITVALTVCPEMDAETIQLVFRVRPVIVVEGSVRALPLETLPVSYDARLDQYRIDTTPEIAEEHVADFFLQRAAVLLDSSRCARA